MLLCRTSPKYDIRKDERGREGDIAAVMLTQNIRLRQRSSPGVLTRGEPWESKLIA